MTRTERQARKAKCKIQARYHEAKKAAGYRRMTVMVPPWGVEDFVSARARLKRKWAKHDA